MNQDVGIPEAQGFEDAEPIVVLAPHPDDKSLGCGALLARALAGAGAHVICLTDGSASHPASVQWSADRLAATRHDELIEAIRCLGGSADNLTWSGLQDGRLHQVDPAEVAADIAQTIAKTGARHVFAPAVEDHHADHKATARIADRVRELHPDWMFYSYPVWSRWDDPDFERNIGRHDPFRVPTGDARGKKRAAIQSHRSQLGMVVTDDPEGFILPRALIEKFVTEDEVFWRTP